jgi:phage terminase large subunit
LYGGAGSGKSFFAAQKILVRILSETNHTFLIIRKVATTLRHSVYALFKAVIEKENLFDMFKFNDSNLEIVCLLNNNKIIFKGLDDPEKIKSITDITSIWIEEATELKEEDLEQINLRLRGKTANYKQIIITFNPISAHHWLKKRFFDSKKDDICFLKTTYKDNPFIDKEYKKELEKLKEQNYEYYKIYALGQWGNLQGLIYPQYESVKQMIEYFEDEFIGMDFGYNHAFAVVYVRVEKRDLYIDELIYKKETTNQDIIKEFKEKYPHLKRVKIFADSARADLINEWKKEGFYIQNANKAVFEGINTLKSFNLFITERSFNILKEISIYSWKKNKEGNYLDEPVKINDDAMDALRYAITPYIKPKSKTKSFKVELI